MVEAEPIEPGHPSTFASLSVPNYRRYFAGALTSNIGTWVARIAQDWLVLVILTNNSATALGLVTTIQFMWVPLLSAVTGTVADRFSKRHVMLVTQTTMAVTSAILATLTLLGHIQLWQVYGLAAIQGIAMAFDGPARMTFVSEMVPNRLLMNAVSLNSASFNAGRLVGPAVGGLLIGWFGVGVGLVVNTVSFLAVIAALLTLRADELTPTEKIRVRGALRAGLSYLGSRKDLQLILATMFVLTAFGMNYQVVNALMATQVFGKGAAEYGILGSLVAVGSLSGALLNARRASPRTAYLLIATGAISVVLLAMAVAPSYWFYAAMLVPVGLCSMTALTTSNSTVQITTEPMMRGRVMALYMALNQGGLPIGAAISGVISDHFGPRYALGLGAIMTALAAAAASSVLLRRAGGLQRVWQNRHPVP